MLLTTDHWPDDKPKSVSMQVSNWQCVTMLVTTDDCSEPEDKHYGAVSDLYPYFYMGKAKVTP